MEPISIHIAESAEQTAWDDFLASYSAESQGQTPHCFKWCWREILENSFGHPAHYLLARQRGQICGILPLIHFKSKLFGASLISLPYLNAGGPLSLNPEAEQALTERAIELSRELNVKYLELRQRGELRNPLALQRRQHKVSLYLPLSENPEDVFSSFSSKLRSQIRRPLKAGYEVLRSREQLDSTAALKQFYQVYSEHLRDLGTPALPLEFFKNVEKAFNAELSAEGKAPCTVLVVVKGSKPVSALIALASAQHLEIPWAASLKAYQRESPNMLLYWTAIHDACLSRYRTFDFGRCTVASGGHRFKLQWGAKELRLNWYYHLHRGELPQVDPQRFPLLVRSWKFLPVSLANWLGKKLSAEIPG